MQNSFLDSSGRGSNQKKKASCVGEVRRNMHAGNNEGDSSCWNVNKLHVGHTTVNAADFGNGNECGNVATTSTPNVEHVSGTVRVLANDVTKGPVLTENTKGPASFTKLVTGEPNRKNANFHTLLAPSGNGVDVAISLEFVRAVSKRFANLVYGFFLGKRVAYLVIENYVKNTWNHEVPFAESFHEQTDEERTEKEQMMKGSDIEAQEKKAKLFNEWERFTSTDGESIESYCHRFSKLMNDFKRNKHFPEKIANNLKFINNLQPEWKRHITIGEVNELRAEELAKTHDPLALMENSQNPYNYPMFHPDHPSQITYMQHPPSNNNYVPQPSLNTNYIPQLMPNPEDISNPTNAINMALVLMAKAFKLN
ncbi:hypothetical protein Tco_0910672 [Tanacetum coccineum]|uniref:Retrotransposon gag domain-containing protein n=1 Tax=Tanacetum coccineum TaxID=301880 RepID=A0ABQ5CV95_9ASTR